MRARPSRYHRLGKSTAKTSCRKAFTRDHRKLGLEPLEHRLLLSGVTFTVTNINDSGDGSLRQAILEANLESGADFIAFDIGGGGPHTIQPLSRLNISDPVTIDGTTQPDFAGSPIIELDGSLSGMDHGLWIDAGGCTVRGLVINRFNIGIILYDDSNGNVIEDNYIGTNVAGTLDAGNIIGVEVMASSGNRIERNVISGNDEAGVLIKAPSWANGDTYDNIVAGNYIGTDKDGTFAVPNKNGVFLSEGARNNIIGTDGDGVNDGAERNVISGNTEAGVYARGWNTGNLEDPDRHASQYNTIAGNYIGTDKDGTMAVPNDCGICFAAEANDNVIDTNIISGNDGEGIYFTGPDVQSNVVTGNYIGTNAAGDAPLANGGGGSWTGNGICIDFEATQNRIGTDGDGVTDELERNVISGNRLDGVRIQGGASFNEVAGNYIGTDASGTVTLGNRYGVFVNGAADNFIGTGKDNTANMADRNVISGNSSDGVRIEGVGTNRNVVAGNYIGTNASGDGALGNVWGGVSIVWSGQYNRIGINDDGAPDEAERNVISGNVGDGVVIWGEGTDSNQVSGNLIGTDKTGLSDLGNGGNGAGAWWGAKDNTIGGSPALANTIAFNVQAGVVGHWTSNNNPIRANSIHSNGGLGIDLHQDGVTANDLGDADGGPNNLQNFPAITSVTSGSETVVTGTLNSTAITAFTLDFYANTAVDPSGHGEGERWLGSTVVTTEGSGDVTFNATGLAASVVGESITATATDPSGNTSEFSEVLLITNTPPVADDQAVTTHEDVPVGVVLTASDDDGDPLIYSVLDGPDHGTLSGSLLNLTYTPTENYFGSDSFTFKANDAQADSNVATVSITVNSVNDIPVAFGGNYSVTEDGRVGIVLSGQDVETLTENLTFTVTSVPVRGVLKDAENNVVAVDDTFTGAPTLTFESGAACEGIGQTSFEFTVTDEHLAVSDPATVTIDVTEAVAAGAVTIDADGVVRIGGTSGDDDILITHTGGTYLEVTVNGAVLSNTIPLADVSKVRSWGRDGNDRIRLVDLALMSMFHGGNGDDELTGGAGDDLIFGGFGNDKLTGASGNDFLIGGDGSDRIVGSAGHDILVAGDLACSITEQALWGALADWVDGRDDDDETIDDVLDEALITDDDFDMLTGSSGADLFIINDGDKITDLKKVLKDGDVITYV